MCKGIATTDNRVIIIRLSTPVLVQRTPATRCCGATSGAYVRYYSWRSVAKVIYGVRYYIQRRRKQVLQGEFYHKLRTWNQEGRIKQLRSCSQWHSTWGVSVLKVCNTSESSHQVQYILNHDAHTTRSVYSRTKTHVASTTIPGSSGEHALINIRIFSSHSTWRPGIYVAT
jgi:hypothetical protein